MGASLEKWPEVTGGCGQDRAALQWPLGWSSEPQGSAGVVCRGRWALTEEAWKTGSLRAGVFLCYSLSLSLGPSIDDT